MLQPVRSRASKGFSSGTTSFAASPLGAAALPFINGGIAGMTATTVIQPIDMVKVRIQLSPDKSVSPFAVARDIVKSGRFLDLYSGLSAGLLRQAIYTTARLGLFDTFITRINESKKSHGGSTTFVERSAAGLVAGGVAAFAGNPADLSLIRMQSDGLKPPSERSNYKNVLDALIRISKSEGIKALWTGCSPTVVRAMALNLGQLTGFSQAKSLLKNKAGVRDAYISLPASAIAGFFASFLSLPFDFVKTRLQKQTKGSVTGGTPYKGVLDCTMRTLREDGILRFWRGFTTYYFRIAPHAMVTLLVADSLAKLFRPGGGLG